MAPRPPPAKQKKTLPPPEDRPRAKRGGKRQSPSGWERCSQNSLYILTRHIYIYMYSISRLHRSYVTLRQMTYHIYILDINPNIGRCGEHQCLPFRGLQVDSVDSLALHFMSFQVDVHLDGFLAALPAACRCWRCCWRLVLQPCHRGRRPRWDLRRLAPLGAPHSLGVPLRATSSPGRPHRLDPRPRAQEGVRYCDHTSIQYIKETYLVRKEIIQ